MISLFEIRKGLHRIPEAAFKEFKTTEFILQQIKDLPSIIIHKFPFTGLLVEYSQGDGDYILFRAELDALPIQEQTGVDFSSTHDGYMHACGHDVHMAILIGLIREVVDKKLKKNILFLFQPAEEGHGGAESVLSTGLLDNFSIKEAYALHVHPNYPVGTIACRPGILFGIPQEFDILFKGKSAHAANPHKGNDAILAATSFCNNIYAALSKSFSNNEQHICHIGKISGGDARNIVAANCLLEGTLRSYTKEVRDKMKKILYQVAESTAGCFGVSPEVNFLTTYDPVMNDASLYHKLQQNLPSDIKLIEVDPALTGEDFGFFTTKYKGLMFWLGAGEKKEDLHSSKFLPDEEAITIGLKTFLSFIN